MASDLTDVSNDETSRLVAVERTGLTNEADETMERLAALVARLLGASVGLVSLVDDRRQFFPGQLGLDSPWSDDRQTPLSQSLCRIVVDTKTMVQIDDAALDERAATHGAREVLGVQSYLGAPLLDVDGRVLGSLCAIEPKARMWTADERRILADLAFGASSDLRARIAATEANIARAEAERARHRVELMAEVTTAMLQTLDPALSIVAMLDVVVQRLATWAMVFLSEEVDEVPNRAFVRHRDRQLEPLLTAMTAAPGFSLYDMPLIRSVLAATVDFVVLDRLSAQVAATGRSANDLFRRLGLGSTIIVPIHLNSVIIGVLVLVGDPDRDDSDVVDLTVAGHLAQRASMTFDHARLYAREKRVASELQHSLLPVLADVDPVGVDVVYMAASHGVDVGGDWYDLIALADGSLIATIGDVTGHSIQAAAAMGRVQVAARIFASMSEKPADILDRLAAVAGGLLGDLLATCLVVHLIPQPDGSWTVRIANAGHLPPLIVRPGADPAFLDVFNDALIGPPTGEHQRRTAHFAVPTGSTLFLYTDGLIEHRLEHIDDGMQRLRMAAMAEHSGPIAGLCRRIVTAMNPSGLDDIACIALRL